ncbi:MAG: glycosyltransferase family 4 protein [bacterium]
MPAKKILILKFPYSSVMGGGEKHTLTLVEELEKRGLEFKLLSSCPVLLREFSKNNWPKKKISLGKEPVSKASILFFPLLVPWILFRLLLTLAWHRLKGFDVLYCLSLTEKIVITPWARLLGYKAIWMEHVSPERWLTLNPYRIFYWAFSRLATIVTVSEAVKNELLAIKISEDRIRVVYHGVDLNGISLPANPRTDNLFVIGTVCRLNKEKGVEYLLRAAKIATEFIVNLQLIIVGDGEEKDHLEWLANKLGLGKTVLFVGWQKDLDQWLANFDIFVLPSVKRESFGLVLLDAMAHAKPIIASRLGGIPEVIDDQVTGLLVKPGDADDLAQAIINLHRQPKLRQQMGRLGYERAKENFNLEKMMTKYYQIFTR